MTTIDPERRPDPASPAVPEFTLGDRLRKAREYADLDQQHLAAAIDIHRQTVARYETGAARPKRHVMLAWSDATGVSLAWIQGTDQQREQTSRTTDSESSTETLRSARGNTRVLFTWKDQND